ncbi:hypothetical protein Tco_1220267 [Tanacetum coccineum]
MRMGDANMLKKSSEKHSKGKSHNDALGHTNHSIGDVVGKIKVLSSGKTVEHVAETSIGMLIISREAYGIFTEDDFPIFEIRKEHHELARDPHEEVDKCQSKFLKMKSDFDISNDKSDGEASIQVTNKTDTFVELKNKYRANFLVDIENTIKSNSRESGAKVRLVLKIAGSASSVGQTEPASDNYHGDQYYYGE